MSAVTVTVVRDAATIEGAPVGIPLWQYLASEKTQTALCRTERALSEAGVWLIVGM